MPGSCGGEEVDGSGVADVDDEADANGDADDAVVGDGLVIVVVGGGVVVPMLRLLACLLLLLLLLLLLCADCKVRVGGAVNGL